MTPYLIGFILGILVGCMFYAKVLDKPEVVNRINMRDSISSLVKVEDEPKPTADICFIMLPIGLIIVGVAVVYFWYRRRRQNKALEVIELDEDY